MVGTDDVVQFLQPDDQRSSRLWSDGLQAVQLQGQAFIKAKTTFALTITKTTFAFTTAKTKFEFTVARTTFVFTIKNDICPFLSKDDIDLHIQKGNICLHHNNDNICLHHTVAKTTFALSKKPYKKSKNPTQEGGGRILGRGLQ